jgi:hypothetical protein
MEGRSFLPLLRGKQLPQKLAYVEQHKGGNTAWALVGKKYHFIKVKYMQKVRTMLFDLEEDPDASYDISEERKEVTQAMHEKLQKIYQRSREKTRGVKKIKLESELKEHFRSLGYLQ